MLLDAEANDEPGEAIASSDAATGDELDAAVVDESTDDVCSTEGSGEPTDAVTEAVSPTAVPSLDCMDDAPAEVVVESVEAVAVSWLIPGTAVDEVTVAVDVPLPEDEAPAVVEEDVVTEAPPPTDEPSLAESVVAPALEGVEPPDEDACSLDGETDDDDVVTVELVPAKESSCADAGVAILVDTTAASDRLVVSAVLIPVASDEATVAIDVDEPLVEEPLVAAFEPVVLALVTEDDVSLEPREDAVDIETTDVSPRLVESDVSAEDALDDATTELSEAVAASPVANVCDTDGTVLAESVERAESVGARMAAEEAVVAPSSPTVELSSVDAGVAVLVDTIPVSVEADVSVELAMLELPPVIDAASDERPVSAVAEDDAVLAETDAASVSLDVL